MNEKLTFLFDNIDPNKGLVPNLLFEPLPSTGSNLIERFIKLTFDNFDVQFKPTYFADQNTPWLYPIFLNHLIFLNSLRHVRQCLPEKIKSGIRKQEGKVIIIVLEPFDGYEGFRLFESVVTSDTPDFIYLTHHTSTLKNVISYDAGILERDLGKIDSDDILNNKKYLTQFDNRRFSCFLYFYMDCPSRMLLLSFLEKTNIINDTFISAKKQARDFDIYLKDNQYTELGTTQTSFSSYDKVFRMLNITETLEKSLINIAVEGEVLYNTSRRIITEKIFRCIEAEKPFIIVSHPKALEYFREQGYLSFSSLIDEGYDEVHNPKERLKRIFKEIRRLSEKPVEELKLEIEKLKPIFEHNKKVLLLNHDATQMNVYKELLKNGENN